MKHATTITVVLLVIAAMAWSASTRRQRTAQQLYEQAVGQYMLQDVDGSRATFIQLAGAYGDMPLGALAQLKLAFLAYDEDEDIDRAEQMFLAFLEEHPEGVMYLSRAPLPDYEGELELVAYYFLGRIAQDRKDMAKAREWFEQIVNRGSLNPANMIVGETVTILRRMDQGDA